MYHKKRELKRSRIDHKNNRNHLKNYLQADALYTITAAFQNTKYNIKETVRKLEISDTAKFGINFLNNVINSFTNSLET